MLNELYAVTLTSVYKVSAGDSYTASAVKIALTGKSNFPVGKKLEGGYRIAICSFLLAYVPEKYGFASPLTGFERQIENVNTSYWGDQSSPIVALFEKEDDAMACFNNTNLQPCDVRWVNSTKEVLEKIGDDHPSIYICHYQELELMPESMTAV